MKANGAPLLLSDIVCVGVYKFDEYKIIEVGEDKSGLHQNCFLIGRSKGEQPFQVRKTVIDGAELWRSRSIKPTGTDTVSDREIFDSLLILSSKVLPAFPKESNKLILSWCKKFGLPFCSAEASQQVGYLACPLHQFRHFLICLRDTFWKVESLCGEDTDSLIEYGIDSNLFDGLFLRNPYQEQDEHFTKERKESLISEFLNEANLRLLFEYRNSTPTFYNYAEDIVSLAKYQFALILLSSGESVPRRCKCCGSMFFASRKNKLYGPCCNRQKRYAAEKRKKEKNTNLAK